MKSMHALLPLAALTLSVSCAHAQTQAPGLWEHSFKMKGAEMELAQSVLQSQLASMPPAQRRQIEEMMKKRGVALGAQGSSIKFCLSKEQAAKPPEARMAGDCKTSAVDRSGNAMHYKFTCTQPQPVSGEGQVTYASDKAYDGNATITTQVGGRPQQMAMDMTGRWLGADCGDLKPVGALPAQ